MSTCVWKFLCSDSNKSGKKKEGKTPKADIKDNTQPGDKEKE